MSFRCILLSLNVMAVAVLGPTRLQADVQIQKLSSAYAYFARHPDNGQLVGVLADGTAIHELGDGNTISRGEQKVVHKGSDLRGLSYGYYINTLRLFSAIDKKGILILDPSGLEPLQQIDLPNVEVLGLQVSVNQGNFIVWVLVQNGSGKSIASVNLSTKRVVPDVITGVSRMDVSDDGRAMIALRTSGRFEVYHIDSTGSLQLNSSQDGILPNSEVMIGRHQILATAGDRLLMAHEFLPPLSVGQILAVDRNRPFAYSVHRQISVGKDGSKPTFEIRAVSENSRSVVGRTVTIPDVDGVVAEESVPLTARRYRGSWFVDTDDKSQSLLLAYGNRVFMVPLSDLQLPDHHLMTLTDESPKSLAAGKDNAIPLVASDPAVKLKLTAVPDGVGVVNNTIRWTPREDQAGDHVVKVELHHGTFVRPVELQLHVTQDGLSVPIRFGRSCQDPKSLAIFLASSGQTGLYRVDTKETDPTKRIRSVSLLAPVEQLSAKRFNDRTWLLATTKDAKLLILDPDSLEVSETFSAPGDSSFRIVHSGNPTDPWAYIVAVMPNNSIGADRQTDHGIFFLDFRASSPRLQHLQEGQGLILEPNGRGAWLRQQRASNVWDRVWQVQKWESTAPLFRPDGFTSKPEFDESTVEYPGSGRFLLAVRNAYTSDLQLLSEQTLIADGKLVSLPDRNVILRLLLKDVSGSSGRLFADVVSPEGLMPLSESVFVQAVDTSFLDWEQFQNIRFYASPNPGEYLVYCGQHISRFKLPGVTPLRSEGNVVPDFAVGQLDVGDDVVFRIGQENRLMISASSPESTVRLVSGPKGTAFEGNELQWWPTATQSGSHKLVFEVTSAGLVRKESVEVFAHFATQRFANAYGEFRFDRESGLLAVRGSEKNSIQVLKTTSGELQSTPLAVITTSATLRDFSFARWGAESAPVVCCASAESSRLEIFDAQTGARTDTIELPLTGLQQLSWSGNLADDFLFFSGNSVTPNASQPFVAGVLSIGRKKNLGLISRSRSGSDATIQSSTEDSQNLLRWTSLPPHCPLRSIGAGNWVCAQLEDRRTPIMFEVMFDDAAIDNAVFVNSSDQIDRKVTATGFAQIDTSSKFSKLTIHPDMPATFFDQFLWEHSSNGKTLKRVDSHILAFMADRPVGISVALNQKSSEHVVSCRSLGFGKSEKELSSFRIRLDAKAFGIDPTIFHDEANDQLLFCHHDHVSVIPISTLNIERSRFAAGAIAGPDSVEVGRPSRFRILKLPGTAVIEAQSLPHGAVIDGDEVRWTPTPEQIGTAQLAMTIRNGEASSNVVHRTEVNPPLRTLSRVPQVVAYQERSGCIGIVSRSSESFVFYSNETGFSERVTVTPSIKSAQAVCCKSIADKDYFVVASATDNDLRMVDIKGRSVEKTIALPTDCAWMAGSPHPDDPHVYYVDGSRVLRAVSLITSVSSKPLLTGVSGVSVSSDGKLLLVGFVHNRDIHDPAKVFQINWNADSSEAVLREVSRLLAPQQPMDKHGSIQVYAAWSPGMVVGSLDMLPIRNDVARATIGKPVSYTIPENSPRMIRIAEAGITYATPTEEDRSIRRRLTVQLESVQLHDPEKESLKPLNKTEILVENNDDRVEEMPQWIFADHARNLVIAIIGKHLITLPLRPFIPNDEKLLALTLIDTPEFVMGREGSVELTTTSDVESIESTSLPEGMKLQNRSIVWTPTALQQGVHPVELILTGGSQSRRIRTTVVARTEQYELPFAPIMLVVDEREQNVVAVGDFVDSDNGSNDAGTKIAILDPAARTMRAIRTIDERVTSCLVEDDSILITTQAKSSENAIVRKLGLMDLAESATSPEIPRFQQLATFSSKLFAVSGDAIRHLSSLDLRVEKKTDVPAGISTRVDSNGFWLGSLLFDENVTPQLRAISQNPMEALAFAASVPWRIPAHSSEARLSYSGDPNSCLTMIRSMPYEIRAAAETRFPRWNIRLHSVPSPDPFIVRGLPTRRSIPDRVTVDIADFPKQQNDRQSANGEPLNLPVCCGVKTVFVAFSNRVLRSDLELHRQQRSEQPDELPSFEMKQSVFLIDGTGKSELKHALSKPRPAAYGLANPVPGLSIDPASGTVTVAESDVLEYAVQKLKRLLVTTSVGSEPISGMFQRLLAGSPELQVVPPGAVAPKEPHLYLPVPIGIQAKVAANESVTLRYVIVVSVPLKPLEGQFREMESQLLGTIQQPTASGRPSVAGSANSPEDLSAQKRIDALEKRIEKMESSLKTINSQLDTLLRLLSKEGRKANE